jgi:hypothetical protein
MPVPVPLQIPRLLVVVKYKLGVRLTGKSFQVGRWVNLGTWHNHHMRLVQVWYPLPDPMPYSIPDPMLGPLPDPLPVHMPDTLTDSIPDPMPAAKPAPMPDPLPDTIIWDVT